MDMLTRDACVLITAETARKAGISPDSFLNRYFGEKGDERDEVQTFLAIMELIYTAYEKLPVWDARWSLDDRSVAVLKWTNDE